MKIIDFHTHCFADNIAERAMSVLRANSQYPSHFDGTAEGLRQSMRQAGIDHSVVLNIATNPRQNRAVNDFAISLVDDPMLIPFGSIHPLNPDFRAEIDRLVASGVRGLKFHPDYQDFFVDDASVYPVYEYAAANGLVMLFHCGMDLVVRDPLHCTPERFGRVIADMAGARIVGAHLGGQNMWDQVFEHILGRDVFLDTSFGFKFMTPDQICHTVQHHDPSRILFASDTPWQCQAVELAEMRAQPFDQQMMEGILGGNAAKLLPGLVA